jgi:serine/threonine protein kinase
MAIHAFGVVHRDLKPSDIIIASDGPRVIDFGIARALEMASLTGPSVVLGTPSFMSPEQVLAREHGPPGDVFALGSVLTFAATGRGAFGEGHPWAVLNNIVQAEPDLADVPDTTLRKVIAACLAKEPGDRPGLEELLTRLLDPAPTPQAWLPPAVRDLTDSYSVKDASPAGPDQTAPTRQLHDPPTPAGPELARRQTSRWSRTTSSSGPPAASRSSRPLCGHGIASS